MGFAECIFCCLPIQTAIGDAHAVFQILQRRRKFLAACLQVALHHHRMNVLIARGDLRALTGEQNERVAEKMRAIVAQHLPGTEATIAIEFRYPPMAPTAGNAALLDRLNTINADLGREAMQPYPPSRRGAADISFVAPALIGLGAKYITAGMNRTKGAQHLLETR